MDRGAADRHSDDELASVLEDEVARITSAIPIIRSETPRVEEDAAGGDDRADGADDDADDDAHGDGDDDADEGSGPPTQAISFDDLPVRREPTGPQPTFSPWVATAAIPIQHSEPEPAPHTGAHALPAAEREPEATDELHRPGRHASAPAPARGPAPAPDREPEPAVAPPAYPPLVRAEPLGLVPEELAPRDSEPVPVVPAVPVVTPAAAAAPIAPETSAGGARDDEGATTVTPVAVTASPAATGDVAAVAAPAAASAASPGRIRWLFAPESADLEPTPVDRRVGRASRMFWLWFAATSSLISVGVGATLFVLGLSLRQLLVATLVGVALSFLPLGLGTLAGKWSGQPTLVVSRASFGLVGNIVPTVLALIVKLFWGSVLLWLAGSAAGALTVSENWPGNAVLATSAALAVTILVAVAIAYVGYALVARVQLVLTIASAALIALMVAATWRHVDVSRALAVPDALWTHVVTGAVLVFSYVGLAWSMSGAEVARYQRPLSSGGAAMLWATFGAGVPPLLLVSYGGLLAASNPGLGAELARDPVRGLVQLGLPAWYPAPLLLAVGLSLVSALVLTVYSAGFTLDASGVKLGRRWSTLIAGAAIAAVGVALAATVTDLSTVIRGVPTALAVPVAAWVGVFSGEMMLRTRRFHQASLLTRGGVYPDWRWTNLALLAGATAVGLGTVSSPLPWLAWEGYLFRLVGVDPNAGIGASNIGVVIALAIGMFGVLVTAVPAVRKQEAAAA
ncbi:purine-cytosine permease family protein [Leifsonia sp. 21MFCrub1.1]|uniref:purine-cytosine permease family protein n=1 Tax=Leifsonia sp. 21MFCrub1.1 TaxID=1798223 RepID=UPI0008929B8D|nr:cytosine permease [Leifsonia sp. 21MFCrub1.1]SEA74116.1 Purine-cytosine permease [Leifsonia sp. 21MFCrub1.1]